MPKLQNSELSRIISEDDYNTFKQLFNVNKQVRSLNKEDYVDDLENIEQMIVKMKKGQFDWENDIDFVHRVLNPILPQKDTISSVICRGSFQISLINYVQPDFYRLHFSLPAIQKFIDHPNYLYGTPTYDKALRFHSRLTQVFYLFYLRRDTRYMPIIDIEKLKITDPLTRINTRERNLKDFEFSNKYLSSEFDIKHFVNTIFKNFFPNVTWRYLGANMFMHRLSFQITDYLLQLGVYTLEEIIGLSKVLLEASEGMKTLETNFVKDAKKLRVGFKQVARKLFLDIRFHLSRCLIHIIILINDYSLKEAINWPHIKPKVNFEWKSVFFRNKEINSILCNILFKFILKSQDVVETDPDKSANRPTYIPRMSTNIDTILMMLVDLKEDVFLRSSQAIQSPAILYYYQSRSKHQNLEKASEIKENMISLIVEIYGGEYGDLSSMTDKNLENTNTMLKGCDYMFNWICSFCPNVGQEGMSVAQVFARQMALCETNMIRILMDYLYFFGVMVKDFEYTAKVMRCLKNICANNHATQAQLFIGDSQLIFQSFTQESPLLGIMLCKMIFWDDSFLFSVNQSLADTIIDFYKSLLETLFTDSSGSVDMNAWKDEKLTVKENQIMIVALYFYNEFLIKMIDGEKELHNLKNSPLDLKVQTLIAPYIEKYVTKVIQDPKWLNLPIPDKEGRFSISNYEFQLLDENLGKLAELRTRDISLPEASGLYFELCFSFVKLLNKSSIRLFFHSTYSKVSTMYWDKSSYMSEDMFHPHLSTTGEGLLVRTELLKLFTNMNVFQGDALLSKRDKVLDKKATIFFEDYFSGGFSKVSGVLINEINLLSVIGQLINVEEFVKVGEHNMTQRVLWVRNKLSSYILKGLFPAIFKYISGLYTLFFVDKFKLKNESDSATYYSYVQKICRALKAHKEVINQILGTTNNLPTIEQIDEIDLIDDNNIDDFDDVNESEYSQVNQYKTRKVCILLLNCIKEIYPDSMLYLISRFNRQHGHHIKVQVGKDQIDITNQPAFEDLKSYYEKEMTIYQDTTYNNFKKMIFSYIELKNEWVIEENSTSNLLMNYFNENLEVTCEVFVYILTSFVNGSSILNQEQKDYMKNNLSYLSFEEKIQYSISEKISDLDREDNCISSFLVSGNLLPYIKFMDQLISSKNKSMKMMLFYILAENDEIDNNVSKKVKKILGSQETLLKVIDTKKEVFREGISLAYYLMITFWHFCDYKVFQNNVWKEIWEISQNFSTFFKNINENKAIYFKKFCSKFKPKVKDLPTFNKKNWTLLFDFYVRTESFYNNGLLYRYKHKKVTMDDKPELFYSKIRYIQVLTEMLTGPCPFNQRTVHIYRTDFWTGIIFRDIDDIESSIYDLKMTIVNYLKSFMEGEGYVELDQETIDKFGTARYKTTEYLSNNIKNSSIYDMIYKLIKRLYLYRQFVLNPGFEASFRSKVESIENKFLDEFKQNSQKAKEYEKRVKDAREEFDKKKYDYDVSVAEDLKIVNPEMKDAVFNQSIFGEKVTISTDLIKKVRGIKDSRQFNEFNKKKSSITDLMLDQYELPGSDALIRQFKYDAGFATHKVLKICVKLYQMLEMFAKVSSSTQLFLDTKKARITRLFGNRVDMEDRVAPNSTTMNLDPKHSQRIVAFFFLLKITRKIEIVVGEREIGEEPLNKMTIFAVTPETMFLENETKVEIHDEIDISNRRGDFQKHFYRFFVEMNSNYSSAHRNNLLFNLTRNDTLNYQKIICWVIGLIINILCLSLLKLGDAPPEQFAHRRLGTTWLGELVILILNIFLTVYAGINLLLWLFGRFIQETRNEFEKHLITNPFFSRESTLNWIYIAIFKTLIKEKSSTSFFCHFIFGILGIVADKVFITFHLLLIVNINETIRYVMRASVAHINQILLTLLLAVFFIYSFSMINANYYSDRFDTTDVGELDVCSSLFSCFLYMLNLGLRNGGGIADSHELFELDSNLLDQRYYVKLMFDIGFFIFVNVISLNIIFGIIIDTFSEMRDEADFKQNEIDNRCMICNNLRTSFEEREQNFASHLSRDHDMWLYPFYIKYLISKDYDDYDGDEIDVWTSYNRGRTDWIPFQKTLFMEEDETIDENSKELIALQEKIDQIERMVPLKIKELQTNVEKKVQDSYDEIKTAMTQNQNTIVNLIKEIKTKVGQQAKSTVKPGGQAQLRYQ